MQNVRFDPRGGGLASFHDNIGAARDAETFELMREKDVVKLVIHDTPDGSSIDLDAEGIEFPHGLKILALNGDMVNTLRKAREARKAGHPRDLTDDELEEHEHAWKQAELLVGPERPPAPDDVPVVIELDRYPPVACILKFDMGGELVPEEVVPADERDASVAMVTKELRITQAWPLVALPAPASKADAVALTTQLRGKKEVYEQRMERLEEVAAEAVDVLNKLFSFVTNLEFKLRHQADKAARIGKRV